MFRACMIALLCSYGSRSALRPVSNATWRQQNDGFDLNPIANYAHRFDARAVRVLPRHLIRRVSYPSLAKMFPAVAVVIAQTARGVQQGKTLDEIKVDPQEIEAGSRISPDLFLKNSPSASPRWTPSPLKGGM
jgi:hypothetical protein